MNNADPELQKLPAWRVVAGVLVLVGLLALGGKLAPIYFHNLTFQNAVSAIAESSATHGKPDDQIRTEVLERASALDLPVKMDNVQITRDSKSLKINVRYVVPVHMLLYTVDLHFYPGAGSR